MFAPPISQENRASAASPSLSGELCAGGDGGTTLFRSVRSDEGGGNPANIAASESSNQIQRDARAAPRSSCERRESRADGGGFSMFAPPIWRRRWRNNAFPFRQIRRRRRQPSENRASGASNQTERDARAAPKKPAASVGNRAPTHGGGVSGGVLPLRTTTTAADSRCSHRRSAGGDGGTTLFRSVRSDEDGGNPANIAASGASNQTERDARAAPKKGRLNRCDSGTAC